MIDIQEKVLLAHHTTFRIGGAARYFLAAQSRSELTEALKWAEEKGVGYLIIGGGSNLLVSDFGFDGLVIKIKNSNIKIQNDNEKCKIITDAGVPLAKIILETTRAGYSGAEWGFGIPGTIGGAICGNAGRLGQDISQVVDKVFILDADFKEMVLSREDCNFDYRESRFKRTGEIILGAELIFQKGNSEEIQKTLSEAKEVVKKYPPFPSAGCIFKNYKLKDNDDLLRRHPELAERVRGGKIGVGYLIDQCGLKGKKIGGAQIWEGHANFIVNVGGAKAKDVLELAKICREAVKEKYRIALEEEVRYIGNFQ